MSQSDLFETEPEVMIWDCPLTGTLPDDWDCPVSVFNGENAARSETSIPPAPDTDLLNLSVSSWLERLSDDERDAYLERAAIMEYDGGLPREQVEVEAIKRIIGARVIVGKCDRCGRVSGCMLTPGQRRLCEVVKL